MKVLMFGWEFPPFNMGGLGTACYGLTKGLVNNGHSVTFVLPKARTLDAKSHVKLLVANNIEMGDINIKEIDSLLHAYIDSTTYDERIRKLADLRISNKPTEEPIYGKNLFEEVYRFSEKAKLIALHEDFDVIHCHDWMTFEAGLKAKEVSKRPMVAHVHATEFDRTGGNGVNQYVYDIERKGMHLADSIIAVSNYTKNMIVEHYGIDPSKVSVVHNAIEYGDPEFNRDGFKIKRHDKIVLFLGRITLQKGPDYFIYAAKRVLEKEKNVKFVVAGTGDMENFIINKAAELGISDKVLFSGFLRGGEIDKAFSMADVYVMPSVSEPFGLTPLEAMKNGTPCIISKQSGVSEVINSCLKVDFWDVDQMANMILSVLKYPSLQSTLQENSNNEIRRFNWEDPAQKCAQVYSSVMM